MNLTPYLLAGFIELPKISVIIGNVAIECVKNQSIHRDSKTFGGFEPLDEITISFKTSDISNPRALKGSTLTVESVNYRVDEVTLGSTLTRLSLVSIDKR